MKTYIYLFILAFGVFILFAFSFGSDSNKLTNIVSSDTSSSYRDGSYEGYSQGSYSSEPFWGHIKITVSADSFTEVLFTIRDSSCHEPVDSMYGVNHYPDIPAYQQQCVNDGHGIEEYPERLMESQNLDHVDAITGATWSYNIFMASAHKALENAHKPNATDEITTKYKITIHVWPNPSSGIVNMEYQLPEESVINLSIYNAEGRRIDQLVNEVQTVGTYKMKWSNHSKPGVYYYHLAAGAVIISGQFICVK
jgi:major membrane immunogen (membrane-anchored lipoprotein)